VAVSWSHRLIVDKVINHMEGLPSPWWAVSLIRIFLFLFYFNKYNRKYVFCNGTILLNMLISN
jgi:phosphatidylserine synthase